MPGVIRENPDSSLIPWKNVTMECGPVGSATGPPGPQDPPVFQGQGGERERPSDT